MTQPDQFDSADIRQSASIATLKFLPQCESTNDSAIAWIREEVVATPALVLTAYQTHGRGQQNRTWVSVQGNLAATWIFSGPGQTDERAVWAGRLSIATALAIYDTIAQSLGNASENLFVKWPNDIYISNRKVAGVLIETIPGTVCSFGVIGIGINVNKPAGETDPDFVDVAEIATSIRQHAGRDTSLTELVISMSRNLIRRIESLANGNNGWAAEYNSRLMYINRRVTIQSSSPQVTGWCRGINFNGAMQIETTSGFQFVTSGRLIPDTQSIADGPAF